jgi:hypothetical protein
MENIDLQWFFKLPGLFITGGVILIIIALIVYIVASAKEKKMAKASNDFGVDNTNMQDNKVEDVQVPLVNPSFSTEVKENNINTNNIGGQPVTVTSPIEEKTPVVVDTPASFEPTITPVEPVSPVVTPQEAPVTQNDVKSDASETPSVTPIITPIEPVNVVTPQVPENVVPENADVQIVTPVVDNQPVVQEKLADEVKTVEVNVAPPVEVSVAVPEVNASENVVTPEVTPVSPLTDVKINEPIVINPVQSDVAQETKVPDQPVVEISPQVTSEDNIEEI